MSNVHNENSGDVEKKLESISNALQTTAEGMNIDRESYDKICTIVRGSKKTALPQIIDRGGFEGVVAATEMWKKKIPIVGLTRNAVDNLLKSITSPKNLAETAEVRRRRIMRNWYLKEKYAEETNDNVDEIKLKGDERNEKKYSWKEIKNARDMVESMEEKKISEWISTNPNPTDRITILQAQFIVATVLHEGRNKFELTDDAWKSVLQFADLDFHPNDRPWPQPDGTYGKKYHSSADSITTLNTAPKSAKYKKTDHETDSVVTVKPAPKPAAEEVSSATKSTSIGEYSPTSSKIERKDVPRERQIVVIGDLHSNYLAFANNLQSSGQTQNADEGEVGEWKGGRSRLVFVGDILGDRGKDGMDILLTLLKLRKEARSSGGSVDWIAGNHDDYSLSFLAGTLAGKNTDVIETCRPNEVGDAYYDLLSLGESFGSDELKGMIKEENGYNKRESWDKLKGEREIILENMRKDTDGKRILEAMCSMCLAVRNDDQLIIHTELTNDIVDEIINRHGSVKEINALYQEQLRGALLGKETKSDKNEYRRLQGIFLDTNNRVRCIDPRKLQALKELGINHVLYGHQLDAREEKTAVTTEGVTFTPTDYGAGRGGDRRSKRNGLSHNLRSIALINTDGKIFRGKTKTEQVVA